MSSVFSRISFLILTAALVGGYATTTSAAPSRPLVFPEENNPGKTSEKKSRKRARPVGKRAVAVPTGVATSLPPLTTKNRTSVSFQRATTPETGGVILRTMSQADYIEYAEQAEREAQETSVVQFKEIAPPQPVEKMAIDELEKQILAEVQASPVPPPAPFPEPPPEPPPEDPPAATEEPTPPETWTEAWPETWPET